MRVAIFSITLAILLLAVLATAVAASLLEIPVGESRPVDGNLTVGFDNVTSDGRCPVGLYCFWEGDAACTMWATLTDGSRYEFALHTSAMFEGTKEVGIYTITLVRLDPYPVFGIPRDPGAYVSTVIVTTPGLTPVEETSWGRIKSLYAP
jgi:hypothetical protein